MNGYSCVWLVGDTYRVEDGCWSGLVRVAKTRTKQVSYECAPLWLRLDHIQVPAEPAIAVKSISPAASDADVGLAGVRPILQGCACTFGSEQSR
jgi:hypothetical protein